MARAVETGQSGELDRSSKQHQKSGVSSLKSKEKPEVSQYGATAGGWAQTSIIRLPSAR